MAGSGKSTTGLELVKRLPGQGLIAAFGKNIADEFQKKVEGIDSVTVKTYNAFGWGMLLRALPEKPKLDGDKTENILRYNVLGEGDTNIFYKTRSVIKRLISLFKNMGLCSVDEANVQLDFLVDRFDIELPTIENFEDILWDTFTQSVSMTKIMDFDDQKYMPIKLGLPIPQYDFLIIDEYQDTCAIETMLIEGSCRDGRIFAFGDPDQCIYSFKGTTPDAMTLFEQTYGATKLPLSICYRCPVEAINEAKKIVPRIEAAPGAIQGHVETIKNAEFFKRASTGDLVLCRITASLVVSCLKFLKLGREAYVEGKEVGTQLIALIEQVSTSNEITSFSFQLRAHKESKLANYQRLNRENAAVNLIDKCEAIEVLMEDCLTVKELIVKIKKLFKEKSSGIRHMTIHKSKGLEGGKDNDVYILEPELLPHPRAKQQWMKDEEMRLLYVARTRTRRGLYYVPGEKNER